MYYSNYYHFHPLLIQHMFLYGLNSHKIIDDFLFPEIRYFHNPFLLNDMKKAIFRIINAIINKENILIFGDYDCDGITSTSIVLLALKKFEANVSYRLPLREEGYGITPEVIDHAAHQNISLIITVDNGSSAHAAMNRASQKGIDLIVTDHHEILGEHPSCYAFVNPKRKDNQYPFTHLAGAGVAFKLVHALYLAANRDWKNHFHEYIELATLGTIADLMPLVGENRVICKLGLRKWNAQPIDPLRILSKKLRLSYVNSSTIGFSIAPLFNSLGRIDDPNIAVSILTNYQIRESELSILIETNDKRKKLTFEQYQLCEDIIQKQNLYHNNIIIVHGDFHHGLIGIVASRIADVFGKPAIVISSCGTASCRSVNGSRFSIIQALNQCSHLLRKYGGHQAAAGFSIDTNELHINQFNKEMQISSTFQGIIQAEKQYLTKLSTDEFSSGLFEDISSLEPFGQGFPQPIFLSSLYSPYGFHIKKGGNGHATFHSRLDEKYYLFNKENLVNLIIQQPFRFFYTSTLSKAREFIVHDFNNELFIE
jgi:single-stranded-DNA-specific exonuclease